MDRIREPEIEPDHICGHCNWRGPEGVHDTADAVPGPTCRRHAPVATGGMMSGSRTMWPVVALTDWCGDFEHTKHL